MSLPAVPRQSPGGGPGGKASGAPGISHFLVAENGLKYQKILQFIVLQNRPKLHSQCNVISFYFVTAWSKERLNKTL